MEKLGLYDIHREKYTRAYKSGKNVLNVSSCGLGKTTVTVDHVFNILTKGMERFTFDALYNESQYILSGRRIIINILFHEQSEGEYNIEGMLRSANIPYIHRYGKSQRIRNRDWTQQETRYCLQSEGKRDFPGCMFDTTYVNHSKFPSYELGMQRMAYCPFRDECEYNRMKERSRDIPVIISVTESLNQMINLTDSEGRELETYVVLDEGLDEKIMPIFKERMSDTNGYRFTETELLDYGEFGDPLKTDSMKVSSLEFIEFNPTEFAVNTIFTQKMRFFFENSERHIVVKDTKDRYTLHCKNIYDLSTVKQVIYCDATAKLQLASKFTRIPVDTFKVVDVKKKNDSEIIKVSGNYRNKDINDLLRDREFTDIINELAMSSNININIKKTHKEELKDIIVGDLQPDYIQHGLSRGSNKYNQDYDLNIILGTYAYTPKVRTLYKLIWELTDDEINHLQTAVQEQTWNRTRSLYRLTPTLAFCHKLVTDAISDSYKQMSFETFMLASQNRSLNTKQMIELGLNKSNAKRAVHFNKFVSGNTKTQKAQKISRLLDDGKSGKEIIQITGIAKSTVYDVINNLER